MAKRKRRVPVVEVTWRDATSSHGWYRDDELHEAGLTEMRTVGYLVRRTKRDLALAQAVSEHRKWSEVWVIPAAWVKRVRRLTAS